jgi:FkbM family methyltransferase
VTPCDAAQAAGGPLIVGIHNFKDDITGVVQWARDLGYDPVITAGQLPDRLGKEAGSYWLTTRDVPMGGIDLIGGLAERLEDAESVELLGRLARFRMSGDIANQPQADLSSQYMPDLLPAFPDGLRFVDGGAYHGDTVRAFARHDVVVKDWIAFEPDLANSAALSRTAGEAAVGSATLYPCAFGDRTEDIGFADGAASGSGSGSGSHIAVGESVTSQIRAVALDEVVVGYSPNFVKLDVEGAEAAAINGMAAMLERGRPAIAASIYHTPYDLWEIQAMVSTVLCDAKLYLSQYGYNAFDTVLYAIP